MRLAKPFAFALLGLLCWGVSAVAEVGGANEICTPQGSTLTGVLIQSCVPVTASNPLPVLAGGSASALNVTASTVVKATPGKVTRVIVNTVIATAAVTINDTTTTGGAAAANLVLTIPVGTVAGTVFTIDWPCAAGIVASFAGGATGAVAVSFN